MGGKKMKPIYSAILPTAICLAMSCAPVPPPLPVITPSRAFPVVTAPSLPAPTAVPQQAPPTEQAEEEITGLPLEDMAFEQNEDLFAELSEVRLPALLVDVLTLRVDLAT
jgi:hypothetical protein